VAQRNDQVFQLSLTEIAFTISFILLLLLGYLVVREQVARTAAEAALASVQTAEGAAKALNEAKSELAGALRVAGVGNPDEVITKLIAVDDVRAERDRLKKKVEDLDSKLTALTELQQQIEKAARSARPDITQKEVESALALQDKVRKFLAEDQSSQPQVSETGAVQPFSKVSEAANLPPSKAAGVAKDSIERVKQAITATSELKKQLKAQLSTDLEPGKETGTIRDIVTAAKSYDELAKSGGSTDQVKKENSDLRGQVAFLKNRLDARGGRDFPPCWADEAGKVEFLFTVELKTDSVVVTPAWPPRREVAAKELPGVDVILAGQLSNQRFVSGIQGIFSWSKRQNPECRHYVQLKSSIPDAIQSDRARLMVENYFYKTEARR